VDELRNSVVKKYSQPEELAYYSRSVKNGLNIAEYRIITKFLRPPAKILDVGCGAGREAYALSNMGFCVVGIDITPVMVERTRAIGIEAYLMDACNLKFPDKSFDCCLFFSQVIEHIPTKEQRLKALLEAKRVIKSNGLLILTTHSRNAKGRFWLYWFITGILRRLIRGSLDVGDKFSKCISGTKSKGKAFLHIYTIKEMISEITSLGFELIECRSAEELRENKNSSDMSKDWIIFYVAKPSKSFT